MINLTVVRSRKEFLLAANIEYVVNYVVTSTPLGLMLVATIDKFLCLINCLNEIPSDGGASLIAKCFPGSVSYMVADVKNVLDTDKLDTLEKDVDVLVEGTVFQEAVWRSLLNIPKGSTCFYSDLAKSILKPNSVRAVASAVGKNCVAYIIPCHRVIGKNGNILKFASGPEIKRRLMESEGG